MWRAMHDGYQRLSPAVRHERTVTLHRDRRRLVVEDTLDVAGHHACRLAFHIGPEVHCHLDGKRAQLSWQTDMGRWRAVAELPEELDWSTVCGQMIPALGWYSPCFGAKFPIVTLIGEGMIRDGERLITDIAIEFTELKHRAASASRVLAEELPPIQSSNAPINV
jgi:hypothetical protein